ncbi:unnamed protein product, partial [Heterosigma akashiwo]
GFARSEYEGCIYSRTSGTSTTYVAVYVDDIVIASNDRRTVAALKANLKSKYRITDAGRLENFLGLRVTRNRGRRLIHIDQTQFIKDALVKFGFEHCLPASTPMDNTVDLSVNKEYKAHPDDVSRFKSMVGTLAWVSTWSVPEITFAVHKLQRATNYPEPKHFAAAARVFKYLKGTGHKALRIGGGTILRAYCDADFVNDRLDGKSVTGYIIFLGDSPIVWTSRLQKSVSTSTTEAEYLALGECTKDVMWLRYLLSELGAKQILPTDINEDNQACISWATEITVTRKNRHLHVNYHFAREKVQSNEIKVRYIETKEQIADLFTKALTLDSFERFANYIHKGKWWGGQEAL